MGIWGNIMRVRLTCWAAAAVSWAVLNGAGARADVLYATGFERPTFAAGDGLVGTDGWSAPGFLSPGAATISTDTPASGLQAVRVNGADLVPDELLEGSGYEAIGSYRRAVGFDALASGMPVVQVQADVRLDGPQTAQTDDRVTGDFVSANVALVTEDGELATLFLSADGHVYAYGPDPDVDYYRFGVPASLGAYHTLALRANFLDRTVAYLLDGAVLGTSSFADAALGYTSSVVTRGSIVVYANEPNPAVPQTRDQYTAHFDNFAITASAVPEPSSLALMGIGIGLAAAACRRGRRLRVG